MLNGHLYWYQQEWSNQGHSCLQRLTFKGEEPKAAYTVTADEEEAVLDASSSTAPGGVAHYEWQLNLAEKTPVESTEESRPRKAP